MWSDDVRAPIKRQARYLPKCLSCSRQQNESANEQTYETNKNEQIKQNHGNLFHLRFALRCLFILSIIVHEANMEERDRAELESQEIDMAAAILSLSGPCRNVGDVYLACVATEGLGQCRALRAGFEQCSKETAKKSKLMLSSIGGQVFADLKSEEEQTLSAARLVNRQLMEPQQ